MKNRQERMMEQVQQLSEFFKAIEDDGRIAPIHICIYAALLHYYCENGSLNPISAFSHEIMQIAKISARFTYYRAIKDLSDFGYLQLSSSRKRNNASKIYLFGKIINHGHGSGSSDKGRSATVQDIIAR